MGANLTAPVRVLSALVAAVFGITLLGEEVGLLRGTGIALLIVAPLVAFARPPTVRLGSLQIARGIVFGLSAAATYGGSTVLLRWALDDSGLTMLGGLVAHGAAALVLIASLALPGRLRGLREVDSTAFKLFVAVTAIMTLAQVLRFAALESADAAVVAPLTETMAFFGVGLRLPAQPRDGGLQPAGAAWHRPRRRGGHRHYTLTTPKRTEDARCVSDGSA